MNKSVTKVFTLEEPLEKDYCIAEEYLESEIIGICGKNATKLVDIKTTSLSGRIVHSRGGFYDSHSPRRLY